MVSLVRKIVIGSFFLGHFATLAYLAVQTLNIQNRVNAMYAERISLIYKDALPVCTAKLSSLDYPVMELDKGRSAKLIVLSNLSESEYEFSKNMATMPEAYFKEIVLSVDISRAGNDLICYYNIATGSVNFNSSRLHLLPEKLQNEIRSGRIFLQMAREQNEKNNISRSR